jgi:hypothetical protein
MRVFNAEDRCDRCGAQAKHEATKNGRQLFILLCNHHYEEHKDKLLYEYWLIESELPVPEPRHAAPV